MKPIEPGSDRDPILVWRPAGVPGLEVGLKDSPLASRFAPSLVFDYRFVVNGHGRGQVRFSAESYQIQDRDRVFLQHPGEVFDGTFDDPDGASGACVGVSAELVSQLLGDQPTQSFKKQAVDGSAAEQSFRGRGDRVRSTRPPGVDEHPWVQR